MFFLLFHRLLNAFVSFIELFAIDPLIKSNDRFLAFQAQNLPQNDSFVCVFLLFSLFLLFALLFLALLGFLLCTLYQNLLFYFFMKPHLRPSFALHKLLFFVFLTLRCSAFKDRKLPRARLLHEAQGPTVYKQQQRKTKKNLISLFQSHPLTLCYVLSTLSLCFALLL